MSIAVQPKKPVRAPVPVVRRPRRRKERWLSYVFLSPWLIGFFGMTLLPMAISLYLSFTEYDVLSDPTWVGWENYRDLFSDPRYLQSVKVTLTFVLISVPLKLAFALFVAVVLNRGIRSANTYRAIYYLPSLIGASVAMAIVWRQLFTEDGVVNTVLRGLGMSDPPSWLSDPSASIWTLIFLAVWEFGAPMIIFLAGLRQVPLELYEAARVDGASRWMQFWKITWPLLSPIVLFNLVLQVIGSFQAFAPAYVISGGTGGPLDGTLFYTLYLYQQGWGSLHMGYAAAMAWVLLIGIALLTAGIFATSRRWVFYAGEDT
ncbi:carbohydrate ABC transporter permease [Isoptericola sp. BMS4]|uniref:carbohydrate ABC transporter permease n=1 Tax=Isoptericola sp. BMS4 TaxID=2527875 RepID=UPI001F0D2B35|nr:sugar ABC transporter permease [Isoptericola sp. BMS4]